MPMSTACTTARSPLSAKNSMNTKIRTASEEQHEPQRRRDDASRTVDAVAPRVLAVARSSSHFEYAACSAGVLRVDRAERVEQLSPHGLRSSPRVPVSMRSHCTPATDRA